MGARSRRALTLALWALLAASGCARDDKKSERLATQPARGDGKDARDVDDAEPALTIRDTVVGSGGIDVVVFNDSRTPMPTNSWSLQMGTGPGVLGASALESRALPAGELPPGGSIRVSLAWPTTAHRNSESKLPPGPAGGKVALVRGGARLNCGSYDCPCPHTAIDRIAHWVSWGTAVEAGVYSSDVEPPAICNIDRAQETTGASP